MRTQKNKIARIPHLNQCSRCGGLPIIRAGGDGWEVVCRCGNFLWCKGKMSEIAREWNVLNDSMQKFSDKFN